MRRGHLGFKKKQAFRRRLYSVPIIIVLIIVLIFLIRGAFNVYQKANISKKKLQVAQTQIVELQDRQDSISYKIGRLKTNTGIEEEIREKYNVAKEGEEVVVIIEGEEKDGFEDEKAKRSFWQIIFSWLAD